MKAFDVKIVCPLNKREVTHLQIRRDRLSQNDSGETVFRLNEDYPAVEVISVKEVYSPTREEITHNGLFGCE